MNGPTCTLCSEKMTGLDPDMLPWAVWVKANFEDAHLSWCWRGEQDQNMFVQMGRSRARWPGSAHNVMRDGKPASLAFDVFQIRPDGVAYFGADFCRRVWDGLSAACNGAVEWSGDWVSFKEKCHFQLARFKGPKASLPLELSTDA